VNYRVHGEKKNSDENNTVRRYRETSNRLRTFIEPVGDTVEDELRVSTEGELNGGCVRIALVVHVIVVHKHLRFTSFSNGNSNSHDNVYGAVIVPLQEFTQFIWRM